MLARGGRPYVRSSARHTDVRPTGNRASAGAARSREDEGPDVPASFVGPTPHFVQQFKEEHHMARTTPRRALGIAAAAAIGTAAFAAPAGADVVGSLFEAPKYTLGNINGQDGWMKTGPYDAAVAP